MKELKSTTPHEIRQEMLDVFVEQFVKTPEKRCTKDNPHGCYYSPKRVKQTRPSSEGCAIGIFLPEEVQDKFDASDYGSAITFIWDSHLDIHIPDQLKLAGIEFLRKLQELHDTTDYWNEEGLTQDGEQWLAKMKKEYQLS